MQDDETFGSTTFLILLGNCLQSLAKTCEKHTENLADSQDPSTRDKSFARDLYRFFKLFPKAITGQEFLSRRMKKIIDLGGKNFGDALDF